MAGADPPDDLPQTASGSDVARRSPRAPRLLRTCRRRGTVTEPGTRVSAETGRLHSLPLPSGSRRELAASATFPEAVFCQSSRKRPWLGLRPHGGSRRGHVKRAGTPRRGRVRLQAAPRQVPLLLGRSGPFSTESESRLWATRGPTRSRGRPQEAGAAPRGQGGPQRRSHRAQREPRPRARAAAPSTQPPGPAAPFSEGPGPESVSGRSAGASGSDADSAAAADTARGRAQGGPPRGPEGQGTGQRPAATGHGPQRPRGDGQATGSGQRPPPAPGPDLPWETDPRPRSLRPQCARPVPREHAAGRLTSRPALRDQRSRRPRRRGGASGEGAGASVNANVHWTKLEAQSREASHWLS